MNRPIRIILVMTALLFTITILQQIKSDDHGRIGEIEVNKFLLLPLKIDPEVDYNAPEIYFNEDTKVVGKVNHVKDLKDGQEVKVWVKENDGVKLAYKIKVIKE